MCRVYCRQCKTTHEVEETSSRIKVVNAPDPGCSQRNWYEFDNHRFWPYMTDTEKATALEVMTEAALAGVTPDYKPTDDEIVGDLLALEKQQQALAIVLVHNLPGTPLLSFSVYGVGRAYAAALELVEKFQNADNRTGPEEVHG